MVVRLVIRDGVLSKGLSDVKAAIQDFQVAQDMSEAAAVSVGNHDGLARALRESADNWSIRRAQLLKALEWLAGQIQTTIDTFANVDDQMAKAFQTTDGGGQTPSPSSATASSGGSTATPPTLPTSIPATGTFPAAQPLPPADPSPLPPSDDPRGSIPGTPPDGPSIPAAVGTSGPPGGNPRVGGADLMQLLSDMVTKWVSLGGSEQAVVAALAALGLGGMVSILLPGRVATPGSSHAGGGPHPHGASGSGPESVGGAPDAAEQPPHGQMSGVDPISPVDPVPGQTTSPEAGDPRVGRSDPPTSPGGDPVTPPKDPASEGPLVEAEGRLTSPVDLPQLGADDVPDAGLDRALPQGDSADLPPLGAPADGGGNASSSDEAARSVAALPPLATLPPLAAPEGLAPSGGPAQGTLPPLDAGPETAVAAAAPLAASSLQGRPASMGAAPMAATTAALPSLGASSTPSTAVGSAGTDTKEREVRRILADLRGTSNAKESEA